MSKIMRALIAPIRYVANKRAQQRTVNEFLDSIEDILSPAAPLQVP